jgi:hypothetical protein
MILKLTNISIKKIYSGLEFNRNVIMSVNIQEDQVNKNKRQKISIIDNNNNKKQTWIAIADTTNLMNDINYLKSFVFDVASSIENEYEIIQKLISNGRDDYNSIHMVHNFALDCMGMQKYMELYEILPFYKELLTRFNLGKLQHQIETIRKRYENKEFITYRDIGLQSILIIFLKFNANVYIRLLENNTSTKRSLYVIQGLTKPDYVYSIDFLNNIQDQYHRYCETFTKIQLSFQNKVNELNIQTEYHEPYMLHNETQLLVYSAMDVNTHLKKFNLFVFKYQQVLPEMKIIQNLSYIDKNKLV